MPSQSVNVPWLPQPEPLLLTQLLIDFIQIKTWSDAKRLVKQFPSLLSDTADSLLADFRGYAHLCGNEEAAQVIEENRICLEECRVTGIEAAFSQRSAKARIEHRQKNILKRPLVFPEFVELVDKTTQGFDAARDYTLKHDLAAFDRGMTAWNSILKNPHFVQIPLSWRLDVLNTCGNALAYSYSLHRKVSDLEEALNCWKRAIQESPINWPHLHKYLYNLGRSLAERYMYVNGSPADIGEAIEKIEEAVQLTPVGHANLSMYLSNLGTCLRWRYERTGSLSDLDYAIEVGEKAVKMTPPNTIRYFYYIYNLGPCYRERYLRTRVVTDLEQAIKLQEESVSQRVIDDSEYKAGSYTNLGNSLLEYYRYTQELTYLNRAIEAFRKSISLTPPDSLMLPSRRNNLGNGLRSLYEYSGKLTDLEQCIEQYQQAVYQTPDTSPELPSRLYNLGNALRDHYEIATAETDKERATECYRSACMYGLDASLEWALDAAHNWGDWALARRDWSEASESYGYGLQAINRLYKGQILIQDKESWLQDAQGLADKAAYAMARSGQMREALVALESGHAFLLNEAIARDHADIERLRTEDPKAYEHYQQAASRLRQLSSVEQDGSQLATAVTPLLTAENLREEASRAREDMEDAINHIRTLPGYDNFLTQPSFEEIAAVLQPDFTLIYLVTVVQGSLALLARRSNEPAGVTVEAVWADDFTSQDLQNLLIKEEGEDIVGGYLPGQLSDTLWLEDSLQELLPVIGAKLMGRVADHLSQLKSTRLILIPCGLLGLLPLHASRYPSGEQECNLVDEFDITYVPAARVLKAARKALTANEGRNPVLVGIGNPQPHLQPLPFAHIELDEITTLFPASASNVFYEDAATEESLRNALSHATYVHLACHGLFDPLEPLDSELELGQNSQLQLREILAENLFQQVRLVALSACQTAISDFRHLPDEAIGLPGGILQAGAAGVIGTLWSVNDLSTAFLMYKLYEYHLHGDAITGKGLMPPGPALCKAQRWLRQLSRDEILAWVKIIRTRAKSQRDGNDNDISQLVIKLDAWQEALLEDYGPAGCPFADPYYWAAFTFSGV